MKVDFKTSGNFDNLNRWLNNTVNKSPEKALNVIAERGVKALSDNTPKDTGETAKGWHAVIETKGDVSEVSWKNKGHPDLSVNNALLIELGHGTGTGGYVTPKPYIENAMASVWKDAGDTLVKELVKE